MRDLVFSVLISIVTSLIASVVFSAATDGRRWRKMRPKVEFDIYEIKLSLLHFIQTGLEINEYGRRFSFERVEAGEATIEDFNLWLQNKCLNNTYKYDEMSDRLLPIGDKLATFRDNLCRQIDRCAAYHAFMTAEEILLLKKIATKVCVYSYEENAETVIAGKVFRPVNPTLAYMANNFLELSQLYVVLQNKIFSYRKIDRTINRYIVSDFRIAKARKHYYAGEYRRCIRALRLMRKADVFQKYSLLFKAYYCSGEIDKALVALNQYLDVTTLKPISFRNIFSDMHMNIHNLDGRVLEDLCDRFTNDEVREMIRELDREKCIEDAAIKSALEIKSYYAKKIKAKQTLN